MCSKLEKKVTKECIIIIIISELAYFQSPYHYSHAPNSSEAKVTRRKTEAIAMTHL